MRSGTAFFRVVLPLGISFYTFQALSYTIDVYRGDAEAMSNFIDFSCFVSMFPHLVAGPILKFSFLAEQLKHRTLTSDKFARGVAFFMLGLAKKILLANPCGKIADTAFDAGSIGTLDAWFGSIAYAFQIYFDFSGYSDMAIGLGLMLGFVFAKNFDSPYRAESITDFWRRWHISLSTWLREYLYIPLGGNRRGLARTYANLVFTMLLGGLWHGASWNFVIWGGMHGGMLAFERSQGREGFYHNLPRPLRIADHVRHRAARLGLFPRSRSAARVRLSRQHVRPRTLRCPSAALISGIVYQPYYLLSLGLAALVVWAGKADVGLDATDDVAEDDGLLRVGLAGVGRPRHPGIQPVHLFHLLTRCRNESSEHSSAAISRGSRSGRCRATMSRRQRRTGGFHAKRKPSWRSSAPSFTTGTPALLIALFLLTIAAVPAHPALRGAARASPEWLAPDVRRL